jgi:hypothetical protein
MADEEFGRRIPFAFLDDIKNRFIALCAPPPCSQSSSSSYFLNVVRCIWARRHQEPLYRMLARLVTHDIAPTIARRLLCCNCGSNVQIRKPRAYSARVCHERGFLTRPAEANGRLQCHRPAFPRAPPYAFRLAAHPCVLPPRRSCCARQPISIAHMRMRVLRPCARARASVRACVAGCSSHRVCVLHSRVMCVQCACDVVCACSCGTPVYVRA